MKRMAFNLVDEEFDLGDALLVRSGGQEERIALADVKNVNFFPYMSTPQVTMSLRQPSAFTGARQQPVVKALSEHAECMQIGFEQRLLLLALIDVLFA